MPEGDTVYLLARRLDRALAGRRVVRSDFRVPQLATRDLAGRVVEGHDSHGKHLLTRFSGGVTLHSHLLMDGSWELTGPGKVLPRRLADDARLVLAVDDGTTAWGLRLHQLRLVARDQEHTVVGHLGPDPLREDFDPDEATRRLEADPGVPLTTALLDQTRIAGLGNVWANEMAFLTGVSPWTPVGEVDVPALVRRAARGLRHSAHVPGAYQVTTGNTRPGQGTWVYGRTGKDCRRCGTRLLTAAALDGEYADPGNRRAWWCPRCQPGPQDRPDPAPARTTGPTTGRTSGRPARLRRAASPPGS